MDKYLQILRAIHAGRRVSQADLAYFAGYHGGDKFNEATFEKLRTKLSTEEGLKSFTDAEFQQYMDETKNRLTTDPAYREATLALAQKQGTDQSSTNIRNGLNVLLAGSDIATSIGQIQSGRQAQSQALRPNRPPILQRDLQLQQALDSAHAGTLDQSAAIAPAQLANLDQYKSDLANATTASGGQQGAFGAYAQVAANRRNRGNLNLVPLANDIKRQEQQRETQLLGLKLGENQAINQSQGQFYGQDLYQYGLDRQAAAELGQVGRYNLRSSMTGAAGALGNVAGQLANQRYQDLYNKALAYGPDNAQTMAETAHMTDNHFNDQGLYESAYHN
jgi:hypothetical protein